MPAIISITILVQFQYFHKHLKNSLNIKIPIHISKPNEEPHTIEAHLIKKMFLSKILKILVLVFHVHLNKLVIILVMMLIMSKVSLIQKLFLVFLIIHLMQLNELLYYNNAYLTKTQ